MSNLTARISDLSDSGLSLEKMRKTHLLAASAGTGKTYSIQTLYLRLILIEGFSVQQILVVTFTKDATKELRDRLQSVLRGALDYLNGISQITDANDRTKKVVDKAVEEVSGGKDAVKRLLQLALLDFDMAAIYTIHGFCQRVLNRFAFETKQAFDVEPTGDTSDEIDQLCRDWWRRHVYSIDDKVVGIIGERGEFSLEAITALARKIIAKPDAILSPEVKCGGEIDDRIKGLLTGFPVQEKEIDDLADVLDCVRGPIREIQNQLSEFRSAVENREWDKALSVLRDAVQFEKKAVNPCSDAAARLQECCAGLVRPRVRADSFSYDSNGFLKSEKCPDLTPAHTERIREAVEELNTRIAKYESFSVVKMRNGAPVKPYSNFEMLARHFSGQRIEAPDLFETIKKAGKEGAGLAEQVKVTVDIINPAFRVFWNSLLEECRQSACCAALEVKCKYRESRSTATSASFDDLLVNLREALAEDNSGLTVALRNEFRAALIDEFQDTDPVQWGIFEKLFKDTLSPCFLVGDPKQAIYRFRNGDIETYLHATESIVERYPLNENYRSEKRLIDAVNQIFMDSDQRSAFGEGIEYNQPLSAAGKEKGKSLISFNSKADAAEPDKGNIDKHPFKIFLIEDNSGADLPGNNSRAARAAYELTAAGIAGILNNDKLAIGAKPVRKKDIAVLVNTHEQADRIAEELKRLNIPSVRQGTGNVWSTDEAGIMLVVLEAVLDSRNIANVKHALLTSWCGLTVEQIWNLNEGGKVKVSVGREEQDYGLADWVAVFEGLHETWLKRGFPAMFRKLTGILDLKKRLLTAGDKQGQRRLANINHLSETIEEKIIGDRKTPEGVLSWIRRQFDKSTADRGDELKLRLETDDDAVRILTVFTSKGLEFPIVFAPTLFMMKSRRGGLPEYHEGSNLVIATNADEESKAREKDEMEREQVRQIYVALTRAVHRTVVVALRNGVKDGEANAGEEQKYRMKGILGEVLRLPMKKVVDDQEEKIVVDLDKVSERFSNVGGVKCAVEVKEYEPAAVLPIAPTPAAVVAPKTKPKVDASKGHGSFSSLAPGEKKKAEEMTPDVSVDTTGKDRDDAALPRAVEQIIEKPEGIFAFPYGAKTGTCWHEIFEDLTFSAADAEIRRMTEDKLRIHGFLKKKEKEEERISLTAGMVKNVLKTPLPKLVDADCFALESVPDNDRKTEWEFSFATLSGKKTSELQKAISKYEQYKPFVDALGEWDKDIPGGYLTGFVDLLFRKDGRFYIVDWKSNRRNGTQKDFLQKGLEEEISLHRYWVQYLIYCVAVHQYLSKAMDGYKYETHFGGAYYIFLRGVDGKKGPDGKMNGIYANRPPEALVKELSAILGDFS